MVRGLYEASKALIEDVRKRHPGQPLRCPYMIALDKAVTIETDRLALIKRLNATPTRYRK